VQPANALEDEAFPLHFDTMHCAECQSFFSALAYHFKVFRTVPSPPPYRHEWPRREEMRYEPESDKLKAEQQRNKRRRIWENAVRVKDDAEKKARKAVQRPLHFNLRELGSCADLGECQLCVVAFYKARASLETVETADEVTLRVALRVFFGDSKLEFELQQQKLYSLRENFLVVRHNLAWMSYKILQRVDNGEFSILFIHRDKLSSWS
jgi:hypothetical protein